MNWRVEILESTLIKIEWHVAALLRNSISSAYLLHELYDNVFKFLVINPDFLDSRLHRLDGNRLSRT